MGGESVMSLVVILFAVGVTQGLAVLVDPNTDKKFLLNIVAAIAILIQWVMFVHSSGIFTHRRTERYYDITGTVTALICLLITLFVHEEEKVLVRRQIIASSFGAIWTIRLGVFLLIRSLKSNREDPRFDEFRENLINYLKVWTLQGVWVFITLLAILILNREHLEHSDNLNALNSVGIALWVLGFILEVVADVQKMIFKANPANEGKFIQTGVWKISRHPNYLGEIILWIGIYFLTLSGGGSVKEILTKLISPIFVILLLVFVSGIPPLEKQTQKQFGHNPDFKEYKAKTPVLIPLIGRAGDAPF